MRYAAASFVVALCCALCPVAHAAVCASIGTGATPDGNFVLSSYGDYGTPFTVAANCDVTDIKVSTGNTGLTGTYVGVIWDSSDNVLVTGAAQTVNNVYPICNSFDSTVSPGTYALTPGNTYWIGFSDGVSSAHLKECSFTTGTTLIQYYSSGWTSWVTYVPFEVDGASSGGGGGGVASTTATSTTLSIERSETIATVTFVVMFAMLLYFFVIMFRPSRRR